uniref:Secreted protein n=1 Tax=Trichogramma kaykai TaxID=54128 RepID=A0ABD2WE15_9HYME
MYGVLHSRRDSSLRPVLSCKLCVIYTHTFCIGSSSNSSSSSSRVTCGSCAVHSSNSGGCSATRWLASRFRAIDPSRPGCRSSSSQCACSATVQNVYRFPRKMLIR